MKRATCVLLATATSLAEAREIEAAAVDMGEAGIRAALAPGAVAAQPGVTFIGCPGSGADNAYRAALRGPGAHYTIMTRVIWGRPARSLANRFTEWEASAPGKVPD